MRPIDADALKLEIAKEPYSDGMAAAFRCVEGAPTIEAEPVRHGYWEDSPTGNPDFKYCSECGGAIYMKGGGGSDYCPHCGARMDGGERNG